jgi:hypothetical protein
LVDLQQDVLARAPATAAAMANPLALAPLPADWAARYGHEPAAFASRLSSAADRARYRSAVQLHFVATHIDDDLSVISSAGLIELGRDYDSQARGLLFIHGDEEKMPLSETEDGNFGGIVKIDIRQVSKRRWNIKRQVSGLQIRTGDRRMVRGSRKAARRQKGEATRQSELRAAGDGGDALHDRSYGQGVVKAIGRRRFRNCQQHRQDGWTGQIAYSAGEFASH